MRSIFGLRKALTLTVSLLRLAPLAVAPLAFAPLSFANETETATVVASAHKGALHLPEGKPQVKSKKVLVIDGTDYSVIYEKQADVAVPIASITKLMTALVVLDAELPLDETLVITKADRYLERSSYSRLAVGTKLTRGDLMHLALMSSENAAAHALGRSYPGGLAEFVRTMNIKAKALGMTHTRFVDPTGLSSRNTASPNDLAKLTIAASRNELIRHYSTDKSHTVKAGKRRLEFRNTNTLVNNPGWDISVQKTGYISEAGKCLVMQAMIDGRNVVIILLDSFGKHTRVADAKRIRKWMEGGQQLAAAAAAATRAP